MFGNNILLICVTLLSGTFRDRLGEYIATFGLQGEEFGVAVSDDGKQAGEGGGDSKDGSSSSSSSSSTEQKRSNTQQLTDPQKATKELLDGLVASYKERETELDTRIHDAADAAKELRHQNSVLQARYVNAEMMLPTLAYWCTIRVYKLILQSLC